MDKETIEILLKAEKQGISVFLKNDAVKYKIKDGYSHDKGIIKLLQSKKEYILFLLRQKERSKNKFSQKSNITAQERPERVPLSYNQERLWFIDSLQGSTNYHIPVAMDLDTTVDEGALELAIRDILERHEILRTVYREEKGEVFQEPLPASGWSISRAQGNPEGFVEQNIQAPFDLSSDYMLRAALCGAGDGRTLILVMHHIAFDGWSTSILFNEFLELFRSKISGRKPVLPALEVQYADYVLWQRKHLQGELLESKLDYWTQQLKGTAPLELPTDNPRPTVFKGLGATASHLIGRELGNSLVELSKKEGATLFMLLLSVFKVLLHRYSGQEDIAVGSPIANRRDSALSSLIGYFVNTLVLRIDLGKAEHFRELLSQVKALTLSAYEHQDVPFEKIVDKITKQRDMGRNPIFQVMFALQNNTPVSRATLGDLGLKIKNYEHRTAKFDLTFELTETDNGIYVNVEYSTELFKEATIKRMLRHYENLLSSVVADPSSKISELSMLDKNERDQLLKGFNGPKVEYPKDRTIVDLFIEQARKYSNNIAITFQGKSITYRELHERSNRLANYLGERSRPRPDDLIAIEMGIDERIPVAIMGVLKSGAAYVPIDPTYPKERIDYIKQDSKCLLCIDEAFFADFEKNQEKCSTDMPTAEVSPEKLAYVIYTSGTTGKPKGVTVEHCNVVRLFFTEKPLFDFGPKDVWTLFHSFCFDFSVWEIFGALLHGGRLVVVPKNIGRDPGEFHRLLVDQKVTVLNQTPTAFKGLMEAKNEDNRKLALRYVIFGGEALIPKQLQKWNEGNPSVKMVNMYGITETTVHVTYKELDENDLKNPASNIGKAIPTLSLYILDHRQDLLPIGAVGEIYVSGDGLARGYLNRPELTRERFVENPFQNGQRMYRSGDLGRWLPDGSVEYLGRKDDQIKLRGHRIELAEIEHAITKHGQMAPQAAVKLIGNDNEKMLVAYVTKGKEPLDKETLKEGLRKTLPEFMVPAHIVQIEKIPLTPNGKIDRDALPDPTESDIAKKQYVAPRNKTEEKLVSIWEEVLGEKNIGINDDFFNLGGHSLKAITLINKYHKVFNVKLSLKDLFTNTTLQSNSKLIILGTKKAHKEINLATDSEDYALSYGQRRLWILSQFDYGSIAYNMPFHMELEGNYNEQLLAKAIVDTIERHEILRTIFREDHRGEVRQRVLTMEELDFEMEYEDLSFNIEGASIARDYMANNSVSPFNLEKGPLLRATLFRLSKNKYIFYYNMHHIISDGISMDILSRDVLAYYEAYLEDIEPQLPALRIQYKDYAAWQINRWAYSKLGEHREYWLNRLSGEIPRLDLPSRKMRPKIKTYNGHGLSIYLSSEITNQLREFVHREGGTLFMLLLTSIKVLIYHYTGQQDIVIGTPIAGRDHSDLENQIGFYVNTLVLRNSIKGSLGFAKNYDLVKSNVLSSYEHQQYPFDRLVEDLELQRDISRSPIFDILLTVQNLSAKNDVLPLSLRQVTEIEDIGEVISKFDIDFTFQEFGGYLKMNVTFNPDVYERKIIVGFMLHYQKLLSILLSDYETAVGKIDFLSKKERYELLTTFNNTKADYPCDKTIVDLFNNQVKKTPHLTAVVFEGKELTYQQLWRLSNQLANYLQDEYSIEPDDLIGINLERSEWMIVAILGVLKSRAAYVPLDVDNPIERITYMLKDSNCKVLLDDRELKKFKKELKNYDTVNLTQKPSVENLAYVIYTSGSTGSPKGVMIEHKSLVSRLFYMRKRYNLNSKDNVFFYRSFSFDGSIEEYLLPLISGAKCFVASSGFKENIIGNILYQLKYNNITKLNAPPALLQTITKYVSEHEINCSGLSLKHIVSGGDKLSLQIVLECIRIFPNAILHNTYGPTECTIDCSHLEIKGSLKEEIISIGTPILNTKIYILNNQNELVPKGVIGEICIGGDGLARGYLNQPDLTNEKFIPNPFSEGTRIYKTGDLGRWLANGTIEFLGRKDDQVKIRGHRIELGEVERATLHHNSIDEAVIIFRKSTLNTKILVGYFVSKEELSSMEIKSFLRNKLPEYMIPSYFIRLNALPLTLNGKVDKKALPNPEENQLANEMEYVAPRDSIEEILTTIWQDLLGIKKISVEDSFFELGGDSILSIQMISRIKRLGFQLTVMDLYMSKTISGISQKIQSEKKELIYGEQGLLNGAVPLSPIQKRFFAKKGIHGHQFNQSVLLTLPKTIKSEILKSLILKLLFHHDALRFYYKYERGTWRQFYGDYGNNFENIDLTNSSNNNISKKITNVCKQFQKLTLVNSKDLVKFVYIKTPSSLEQNRLFIVAHHLLVDTVSWRILIENLDILIEYDLKGEPFNLGFKGSSYREWVIKLKNEYDLKNIEKEKKYWISIIDQFKPLPVDNKVNNSVQKDIRTYSTSLSMKNTKKLLAAGKYYDAEINDVLLAVLYKTLKEWSGFNSISIGLEGHGRESFPDVDISSTIGWFTSIYPLSLKIEVANKSIKYLVQNTKKRIREVPNKGLGYGIMRYVLTKNFSCKDFEKKSWDVVFNYLGQFDNIKSKGRIIGFAKEPRGDEISDNFPVDSKFEINSHIMDGIYSIGWRYSKLEYNKSTVVSLAENFKSNLKKALLKVPDYQNNKEVNYDNLIELNSEYSNPKLFCIPGLGGSSASLYELGQLLGGHFNAFGYMAPGLDGVSPALTSVENISAKFVEDVLKEKSIQTVTLLGYSFGSDVAFEIVKQLVKKKIEVSHLIILDSEAPHKKTLDLFDENSTYLHKIIKSVEVLSQISNLQINIEEKDLFGKTKEEQLSIVCKKALKAGLNFSENEIKGFIKVYIENINASMKYQIKIEDKIEVPITLIKTLKDDKNLNLKQKQVYALDDLGWGELTTKQLRVFQVDGNHQSILKEPYVKNLAEIITNI